MNAQFPEKCEGIYLTESRCDTIIISRFPNRRILSYFVDKDNGSIRNIELFSFPFFDRFRNTPNP